MSIDRLLATLVAAGIPALKIGGDSAKNVEVVYSDKATDDQRAAGQKIIDQFDWSDDAQKAWEVEALDAAAAVAVVEAPTSTPLGNYAEQINDRGELEISCVSGGAVQSQSVPCRPPCFLFLDPATNNFVVVYHADQIEPAWQFVKFVKSLSK